MSSGKERKADVEGVMKFNYFPVDVSTDVAKSLLSRDQCPQEYHSSWTILQRTIISSADAGSSVS